MVMEPTVLLVEDDPGGRVLFREAVDEATSADLLVATDGLEALDVLPQRNGLTESPPDLIVLDLDLPRLDGVAVLEEYRANNSPVRRTPVLILSGNDDQASIERAYEAGANAYLVKPDDYADLVELVRAVSAFWL